MRFSGSFKILKNQGDEGTGQAVVQNLLVRGLPQRNLTIAFALDVLVAARNLVRYLNV